MVAQNVSCPKNFVQCGVGDQQEGGTNTMSLTGLVSTKSLYFEILLLGFSSAVRAGWKNT
jgi:hypothetical protein